MATSNLDNIMAAWNIMMINDPDIDIHIEGDVIICDDTSKLSEDIIQKVTEMGWNLNPDGNLIASPIMSFTEEELRS